jgi:NAD(P)-dependent dehydrogenase (short-subunit alcohol dehydrogenase family)
MQNENGRVALVTGGGSGIGRATCLAFAREGTSVLVADWSEAGSRETVARIRETGGIAEAFHVDVTEPAEVKAMVDKAVSTFGRIDCAVNAAGYPGKQAALIDWLEAEMDRAYTVNVKGVWYSMREEIRQMLQTGGGAIVNIASVGGLMASPSLGGYGASKHGVVSLTKTAALEHARQNIRVNAICPGPIRTPMLEEVIIDPVHAQRVASAAPMGRIGEPEEIASCAVFLCSPAASYVTGVPLPVDGGIMAH